MTGDPQLDVHVAWFGRRVVVAAQLVGGAERCPRQRLCLPRGCLRPWLRQAGRCPRQRLCLTEGGSRPRLGRPAALPARADPPGPPRGPPAAPPPPAPPP